MEAPRDEAWGTVGVLGDGADASPVLALQGHVDVVPPGDLAQWQGDPFVPRVEGDVVFGRGACDMKAGVVANLVAVEALVRSGVRLPGPIAVHSVGGEEDGGLGAFATLRRGHTADGVRDHRADQRHGDHRHRRCADVHADRRGRSDARQHALRRRLRVRRVPAGLPGAAGPRARAERGRVAADGRVPDRVPADGRPGGRRRLVEHRARPADRRGAVRRPAR